MLIERLQRGFTLIELLITIVVVAVLAALAFPSFQAVLANAQIRTAAQALHDGLQLARVEAIRRNERVVFTKDADSGWTVSVNSGGGVIQTRSSSEGAKSATVTVNPSTATKVTFDALGRVVAIGQLDIDVPTTVLSAAQSKELRVTITPGGAIRLCDPNAPAGNGRAC